MAHTRDGGRVPLGGYRVVNLGDTIADMYCCRLLADGGADVITLEPPVGHPLRTWTASGADLGGLDGALFRYLAAGTQSVVASDSDEDLIERLLAGADAVVWSRSSPLAAKFSTERIRDVNPSATVVAISPYGLSGPWAQRPASDLTLQALTGGMGMRGSADAPPVYVGGRFSEWVTGLEAAKMLLASRWRTRLSGAGELVDVSMLEAVLLHTVMHPVTFFDVAGYPFRATRMANLPDVHPTKDGYVGFMVVTGQQWLDFCVMVERDDWLADESLVRMAVRATRRAELSEAIDSWTAERATDEVLELASLLRIPAAPIGNGETVGTFDHLIERNAFVANAGGGFRQPAPAWIWHEAQLDTVPAVAPTLGQHTAEYRNQPRRTPSVNSQPGKGTSNRLPFDALRIADFTANWAGPVVGHVMAMLGADCIHVESAQRPDAMRYNTAKQLGDPLWWEWAGLFHGTNTDKRDVTLDLSTDDGRDLARRLIASCDVVLENYSPRVMEGFGLGWDEVREINPRAIYVRMPAYGLSGPWRDRPGYAQTMEMISGLAWRTGHPDSPPVVPNGPCDPIAGAHATVALLIALEYQAATGHGLLVEVPMLGGALGIAAEQIIEYSAYGHRLDRMGNRAEHIAPQGVYHAADGDDEFVAISVVTDEQWAALKRTLGNPSWAVDPALDSIAGRQAAHDDIDRELANWLAARKAADAVAALVFEGVPAARIVAPHETGDNEQLKARGFVETLDHPVVGRARYFGLPARLSAGPEQVHRTAAPTLGEHNKQVLCGELGIPEDQYRRLEDRGVIGTSSGTRNAAW